MIELKVRHQRLLLNDLSWVKRFKSVMYSAGSLLLVSTTLALSTKSISVDPLAPLSGLYTNQLLYNIRQLHTTVDALPTHIFPSMSCISVQAESMLYSNNWNRPKHWLDGDSIPVSLSAAICYPMIMIEAGIEGLFSGSYQYLAEDILNGVRGNIVFGNLYCNSYYFKIGGDFIPFGRHFLKRTAPMNNTTQGLLDYRSITFSLGGESRTTNGRVQFATSFCCNPVSKYTENDTDKQHDPLIILNYQYERYRPLMMRSTQLLLSHLLGGGIGASELSLASEKYLLNIYQQLSFSGSLGLRWEYLYNGIFNQPVKNNLNLCELTKQYFSPHAFYIQMYKRVSTHMMILLDYEKGYRTIQEGNRRDCIPVHNVFGGIKMNAFEKRMQFTIGPQWNFFSRRLGLFVSLNCTP